MYIVIVSDDFEVFQKLFHDNNPGVNEKSVGSRRTSGYTKGLEHDVRYPELHSNTTEEDDDAIFKAINSLLQDKR